jgi:hypothetical protein
MSFDALLFFIIFNQVCLFANSSAHFVPRILSEDSKPRI